MTDRQEKRLSEELINEAEVVTYLRIHPDFFEHHAYLLEELKLPHPETGEAISLIERQVSILREREQLLRHKLQNLTDVALANETLLERIQQLLLRLVDCPDLDAMLQALDDSLRREFHADAVAVRLFSSSADRPEYVERRQPELKAFGKVLARGRPVCGHLSPEQLRYLFGPEAGKMASGAIIPLCESEGGECIGLVAVGSTDPKRFHPEMGTVFLGHLGAVASRLFKFHMGD